MANTVMKLSTLSDQLLRLVVEGLSPWGKAIYIEEYSSRGAHIGDTVRVRCPDRFDPWDFDLTRPSLSCEMVVLGQQARHEFHYDSTDLALSLYQFVRRHLFATATSLVHQVEASWPQGATLVTAALSMPNAPATQAQRSIDPDSGIAIRCITIYDPLTDTYGFRADLLYGFANAGAQANVLPQYLPSPAESEMIALLLEAKAELTQQLETLKLAA